MLFQKRVVGTKFNINVFIMTIEFGTTVKPVYKGHLREPENVSFISSCPLYTD